MDSAAAARFLVEEGADVVGVTLNLGESRCCELSIARRICHRLHIPHYVFNVAARFEDLVVRPYVDSLMSGFTPNPCPGCNINIKFQEGLRICDEIGADLLATGHYARKRSVDGRWQLLEAQDRKHSQAYFLALVEQKTLGRVVFPIGDLKKDEVHRIGKGIGGDFLSNQEICFEPELEEKEGPIIDQEGEVIGRHRGHHFYTIGQRKGLRIGGGVPLYVSKKDPIRNEVVLSGRKDLYHNRFWCNHLHWISDEQNSGIVARIRYQTEPVGVVIERSDRRFRITLKESRFAITPGQLVVFNQGEVVLGGGWITEVDA